MSQFSTPVARRSGGDLDVYSGLLAVAFLLLAVGVGYMAMTNMKHSESKTGANDGSMFKLVEKTGR